MVKVLNGNPRGDSCRFEPLSGSSFPSVTSPWSATGLHRLRCRNTDICLGFDQMCFKEEVRAKIQQAIGPREDFRTIVKGRKLQ